MKIGLKDIHLSYEDNIVLDRLSVNFSGNQINCLLGRSGSGKTSILKIIAGISDPYTGNVYFDEEDVSTLPAGERDVGWVPQQQLLFPSLTVRENMGYGLKGQGLDKEQQEQRIIEVAELVGLTDLLDRMPTYLSGGEKQRVAIARALAPNPNLLLMDEPFSSLDAPERERLTLAFRQIQVETEITTIYVTHNPKEAELISDYTYILSAGKILQQGPFDEMIDHPNSVEVAKLLNLTNVIETGAPFNQSNPKRIPSSAIDLSGNTYSGKIIATTRESIYLSIDGVRLLKETMDGKKYSSGETITFDIIWEKTTTLLE